MTRTSQRQTSPQDHGLLQPSDTQSDVRPQNTSANRPVDSPSDNDASERPVREKLKKTSIAAMPKYGIIPARDDAEGDGDDVMTSHNFEEGPTLGEEAVQDAQETRGRPSRKRSFEDLKTTESHELENTAEKSSGHIRKRSRDVKVGEPRKEGGGRTSSLGASVEEQMEEKNDHEVLSESAEGNAIEETGTPPSLDEPADHVMRESALSPRKKRSRDRFEEEIDREQKIAATEETRARKRSQEEEREQARPLATTSEETVEVESSNGHPVSPKESLGNPEKDKENKMPSASGFANTSAVSSFSVLAGSKSPEPSTRIFGNNTSKDQPQTSASAFASSGFAALSESTTSPFGTLNPSSTTSNVSPFGAARPAQTPLSAFGGTPANKTEATSSGGFGGATTTATTSGFGSIGASISGSSGFGTLGGSTFGSGFGSGFGGGAKLTSFAAPGGDAKLGGGASVRAFGTRGEDEEDEDNEDNGEDGEDDSKANGVQETDARFHQQEVETGEEGEETIFSCRAKLFLFDGKNWKERGIGLFKLNVTESVADSDGPPRKTARFIMRALQVFRVMLNTPVFKGMTFGGIGGEEPKGKQINFAVLEDGRPVPYMLRVGHEADAKTLIREVRELQKSL